MFVKKKFVFNVFDFFQKDTIVCLSLGDFSFTLSSFSLWFISFFLAANADFNRSWKSNGMFEYTCLRK